MVIAEFEQLDDNGIAFYRCLAEGKEEEAFRLGLDVGSEEIVFNSLGAMNWYVAHAAQKVFERYREDGKLPLKAISMWY